MIKPIPQDVEKQIVFWRASAEDNYETAGALLKSKRYNFSTFMCQQTLEAILKCAFVKRNEDRPPYLHKISRLLTLSGLAVPAWVDEIVLTLDAHYIKARYFADRFDITVYNKKNASSLFKETGRALKWFLKELALEK